MTKQTLPGPKAKALIERDHKVISPSYPRSYPFVMDHGKGSEVWDVDGNRFLDFMGGIAVVSTGHSHPKVVKAIQEQAEKFIHISSDFYHENWIKLSEKLDEIAPFEEDALQTGALSHQTHEFHRFHGRVPRTHDGRSDVYCQQSKTSWWLLSADERRDARALPESISPGA